MVTGPVTFSAGVKLSVPSGLTTTLPCAGLVSTGLETRSWAVGVSGSVSFALTSMTTAVLISVEAVSSLATGGSFTGVTFRVSVAVDEAVPSETV